LGNAIVIILDGIGVGALPDADDYGDAGSDTLAHTAAVVGGLTLPNLRAMGLGNLHQITGVSPVAAPIASHGRMAEVSKGKDSTTGHWELMGVRTERPYPTYPDGFPPDVLDAFREATGHDVIGNIAASGTQIIQDLGDEHVATGKVIVYTSADSVFQIAAHEDIVPLEELYRICEVSRAILKPPHEVSRVIARPFKGFSGAYERTPNRHDYSIKPPRHLLLARLAERDIPVQAVGKIADLYADTGISEKMTSKSNAQGMEVLARIYAANDGTDTLYLLNLVDFDMLWGHRNNPEGMARDLVAFDAWLGGFLAAQKDGDLLLLTADHGNDPTTPSTDHSREYVPLLAKLGGVETGVDLGVRETFADLGATLAEFFSLSAPDLGRSFLTELSGRGRRDEH
jgi:phosphopentomutase